MSVFTRNLCQTPEEDPSRQPILLLLEEMYNKQPRVGYYFLYFLKVSKVHDEKMSAYKDFCNSMEARDIQSCLMNDLRVRTTVFLFFWLKLVHCPYGTVRFRFHTARHLDQYRDR